MSNEIANIPLSDLEKKAKYLVTSKLFGVSNVEQAVALMLVAQAENVHPMLIARDYHIINGRPSLKADAMLGRFLQAGGKVEWHTLTDELADATFSHSQGGSVRIDWTMARATKAQVTGNPTWKKYPRAMLRARVVSEGIRTVYPSILSGMYTPEEVQDMQPEFTGKTIEQKIIEPIDFEAVYNDILDGLSGIADTVALQIFWKEKQPEINSLPDNLKADIIAKKDECKADLMREKAEVLINE